MSYILVTNIYNEAKQVNSLIQNIANQTLQPKLWIWIDDGSNDDGLDVVKKAAFEQNIEIVCFKQKLKLNGNLDTIGRAWNIAHPYIIETKRADYLAIADVDTSFPEDYFEEMISYMEQYPYVGAVSGQVMAEANLGLTYPMGGGKVTRWRVIQSYERYWDLAPDSFINIKALMLGYSIKVRDIFVESPITTIRSRKGRFRYGRRAYYVWRNPLLVLLQALNFIVKRDFASLYLQGYLQEWFSGTWRCSDEDVKRFYSLKYRIRNTKGYRTRNKILNLLRLRK